jgi:uncharacterized protein (DUF2267 family)
MHHAELDGIETTVHKTHDLLNEIMAALGANDAHLAYGAMRAVLHALRDRLTVDEAVQLGAQLPMLIRGLYYEGWRPRRKRVKQHKDAFLDQIRKEFPLGPDCMHPEVIARAVLAVLSRRISPGEVRDVQAVLPVELRALWPGRGAPVV